ncbi:DUF6083 domain-containing protein [Streptomyces nitrosporeus]|uniref:DUF6083 domain-containing protein n=1 Tax=Streptomyces nitrosporeus TaxID=28894 RepID=UPI00167E20F6|nr:DUF6083 domain-containing protein [Streptomyces nitrosporeus]
MGDFENIWPCPDRPDDGFACPEGTRHALREGAVAPRPPAPPECPFCDLLQDRYPTHYAGHWILLEPGLLLAAHTVPPMLRWIITPDGRAMNLWEAEPFPGTRCRIPHRVACPALPAEDHWRSLTERREHNLLRVQRLFELPDGPPERFRGPHGPEEGLPETG